MKVAYSYIRFSSPEQARGDSLRRQLQATLAWCEEHHLELDGTLSLRDLGVSAFRGKNVHEGALRGFLEAIDTGRVRSGSVLIVESLDRISREEILDALEVFLSILRKGIEIVTLLDRRQYTRASVNASPTDLIASIVVLMRAHEESRTKSKRVAAAWAEKRKTAMARPLTAKCPTWMRLDRKANKIVLIPQRVVVLRRIISEAMDGMGQYVIAGRLNREMVPTFGPPRWCHQNVRRLLDARVANDLPPGDTRRETIKRIQKLHDKLDEETIATELEKANIEPLGRSLTWEACTIQSILRSPALLGTYQPKRSVGSKHIPEGEPVKGYYPAIMSDAEWHRLQSILDRRKTNVRGRQGESVANLFGRMLRSGWDGGQMILHQSHGKRRVLISMNYIRGLHGSPSPQIFPYQDFEKHFLLWVKEIDLSDATRPANQVDNLEGELAALRKRIEVVEDDLRRSGESKRVLAVLRSLEIEEMKLAADLEKHRAARHEPPITDAQRDIERLVEQMAHASGERRVPYRTRLRSRIHTMCRSITVWVFGDRWRRLAILEVELHDETFRYLAIRRDRAKEAQSLGTIASGYQVLSRKSEAGKQLVGDEIANLGVRLLDHFDPIYLTLAMGVKTARAKRARAEWDVTVEPGRRKNPSDPWDGLPIYKTF